MPVVRYLLDTNHVSAILSPVSRLRERIVAEARGGAAFGTCVPVLCELEAGLHGLANPEPRRTQLRKLLRLARIWPLEEGVSDAYGAIFRELRHAGRVLSQVDIMLAAMARSNKLVLLTQDRDFESVPGLTFENWI